MSKPRSYFTIVLCCLLAIQSGAQEIVLHQKHEAAKISASSLQWFIDTTGRLDLAAVHQARFTSFNLLKPKTNWNTWTHFNITNKTGADKELVLQIPKSGYATAFVQRQNEITTLRTGSLLPLQQRSLKASINGFVLDVKNEERISVWLQLQSVYSLYIPRNYDLVITPQVLFAERDNQRLLWQGIFLGIILVMSLYNFFVGVAVKDTSYLYYVLSIVGIGTYFVFYYGFGIEYLWPAAPLWDAFCYLIIVPFSGLMRLLFTRTYLHTPKLLPRTNIVMNFLMAISVAIITMGLVAYLLRWDIIFILIDIIGFTGTSIHLLMLIAGIIAFAVEKYRPAKYFIWANIVLVIGAVLFIGRELGLLNDNFMTRYLVQIGFLIQVVVFSLGLASRLNEMRNQLARESLEREKEKKALIEEQRTELLLQVAQQTKDLKEKNAELERSFALVKESEHKLTQLNEIKNKLFSVISHDLRNPLATMQSFLKLVTEHQHKLTEEEKLQLFTQAQQSLDNLNLLLYNLLQWSRSQMNLLEFKPEKIHVRSILDNCVKVLKLNAHMKNISVKVQTDDTYCGYADKEMTEFIVRNLISNAIKFSHRDNEVLVKAYRQNGDVVIEVKDSGVGMSEGKIRKLLELSTTITRRGTEKEKGTGLGLLISKEFIEKNKGVLSITSEPGKGSSFSFTIQSAS